MPLPPPQGITCALTLRQPWAWCIAAGHKDVENRDWPTTHRGWLAIHAGGEWANAAAFVRCAQLLGEIDVTMPPKQHLTRSAIIGVVYVDDCLNHTMPLNSPWAERSAGFHWLLRAAVLLPAPMPCSGSREVWTLSAGQSAAMDAQLAAR
jgi:ASCH domain